MGNDPDHVKRANKVARSNESFIRIIVEQFVMPCCGPLYCYITRFIIFFNWGGGIIADSDTVFILLLIQIEIKTCVDMFEE